jgi:cell division transport system ATP-binding protein
VNRAPLVQAPSRWLISDALSTNPAASADPGAAAPASPIVRFDQVGLAGGPDGWILRGLSFALAPGSFHWLTGGAGKTSLLGLIGLVERPSQGVAQVFGRDAAALSRKEAMLARRRIGLVLEPLTFVEHLSAWDNAVFAARVTGRKPDDYAGDVNAILKWLGLAKAADDLPSTLGVADRHRLAFARALLNRPELLLIDEPADGFDDAARQRAFRLADEIHGAGATVVMVCRDEAFAAASGRPVIRLQDGRANLAEPEPA